MLKKVIIEEDGIRREYEDVLCHHFWTKEDIIDICTCENIDIENESDRFWNYLAEWMDGCEYYPDTSEDMIDCVNQVLARYEEWDI